MLTTDLQNAGCFALSVLQQRHVFFGRGDRPAQRLELATGQPEDGWAHHLLDVLPISRRPGHLPLQEGIRTTGMLHELDGGDVGVLDGGWLPLALRLLLAQRLEDLEAAQAEVRHVRLQDEQPQGS